MFHESNERFSEGTLKQEGTVKNVARNFYIPLVIFVGIAIAYRAYEEQYRALPLYEDYLDWLVFQSVKRGHRVEQLARAVYKVDQYSVEARNK